MTTERAERLKALYDLGVELSALRSVPEVLDTALAHCLDLTASQFGFIGLVDPDLASLEIVAIRGFHPSRAFFSEHRTIPLRPNLFASVILENRAARVDDAQTDPNRVGQPSGHPLVGTFLGVPLRFHDHAIGMIGVANRQSRYDDDHERLMDTYAAQVAIVIRNAQLNEALEQANEGLERTVAERTSELNAAKDSLARHADELRSVLTETVDVQEAERRRIARDLHDGVNQLLIGAMLELKATEERLKGLLENQAWGGPVPVPVAEASNGMEFDLARGEPSAGVPNTDPAGLPNSLSATLGILRQVEQEVRRVVNDLHPPTLETLGLPAAVKRLTERLARFFSVSCEVNVRGNVRRVGSRSEVAAYRVVQEALQNVARHSGVDYATVEIGFNPDKLTVSICDEGKGFDVGILDGSAHARFGLLSMRERAEGLGGSFEIVSTVGTGTEVRVSFPIDET